MNYMDENEELYRAWIGSKNQDKYYECMRNGGFSWGAMLLSGLLFLTRKMFVESILYLLLLLIIHTFLEIIGVPDIVYIVINLGLSLTIGYTYYYLYRWNIKRKIEKYKRKGYSYEQQLDVANKYGGDKITVIVIIMFIAIILIFIFILIGLAVTIMNSADIQREQINTNSMNISNTDSSYIYNNYNNSNNSIQNNTQKSSWILDSISLSYDFNNWKLTKYEDYNVLQYKNKENYLIYLGKQDILYNNGILSLQTQMDKKNFEETVKTNINDGENIITYLYSNWDEISNELYLCKMAYSGRSSDYSTYAYINDYYYISNSHIYIFETIEEDLDYTFNQGAEEIMNTIKNNKGL